MDVLRLALSSVFILLRIKFKFHTPWWGGKKKSLNPLFQIDLGNLSQTLKSEVIIPSLGFLFQIRKLILHKASPDE